MIPRALRYYNLRQEDIREIQRICLPFPGTIIRAARSKKTGMKTCYIYLEQKDNSKSPLEVRADLEQALKHFERIPQP